MKPIEILDTVILTYPFLLFIFLTVNNQILGIDSWYWTKFTGISPLFANIFSLVMYYAVYLLFRISQHPKWKLLAFYFLINPFTIRFFIFELDDYFYFLASFIAILAFKKYRIHIAVASVLLYLIAHPHLILPGITNGLTHIETAVSIYSMLYVLPAIIFLFQNNRKALIPLLVLLILSPTGKFSSTALPVLIFSLYLSLRSPKANYMSSLFLAVLMIGSIFIYATHQMYMNNYVEEKFCSKNTCHLPEEYWQYGHYLAYKGYVVDGGMEYGVCRCYNRECLLLNLTSCR